MGTHYDDFYNFDYYDFSDLYKKAIAPDATKEDINALGYWMSRHGRDSWNGEYYSIDSTHELYPIYKEVGYDDYEIVGYTFSSWDERIIPLPMPPEERAKWEAEEEEKIHRENIEYTAEKKRRFLHENTREGAGRKILH